MAETASNPTYLERTFGFESEALRKHMEDVQASYPALREATMGLKNHPQPAAQFVCGWTLAERATHRVKPEQYRHPLDTFKVRNEALNKGNAHWRHALEQLSRLPSDSPYLALAGGILDSNIRQAIAYKPLLELVIAQRFRLPITEEARTRSRELTAIEALKIGEHVVSWEVRDETEQQAQDQLLGKLACGVLGQSPRYTIVPAPARRLYSELPGRRLDYLAVPVEPPYFRVPFEIVPEAQPNAPHNEHTLVIDASQELVLRTGDTLGRTFSILQQAVLYDNVDAASSSALDDMRDSLTERFDQHRTLLQSMAEQGR